MLSFLALSLGCLLRKIKAKKVPKVPVENPEDPEENLDDPELENPEEAPVIPNITKWKISKDYAYRYDNCISSID